MNFAKSNTGFGQKFPTAEEYQTAEAQFNRCLSGSKIFILNHIHGKEFKYNYTNTKGKYFSTNNRTEFLNFLERVI